MAKNQTHRMLLGRLVLSLFVFAWAGASAQPCLMAMDMSNDAPMAGEHSSHGAHHSPDPVDTEGHDCDHCPPGGHRDSETCASGLNADCGAVSEVNADTRTSVQKWKDVPGALVLPGPPADPPSVTAIPPPAPIPVGQLKYRAGPSLSIRNCVFLK